MTTILVASNPSVGSNTGIARTLNQAATVGNSLIAWFQNTAGATNTLNGCIDNASNAFTQDYTAVDGIASDGVRFYRRTNIANAATSVTPQATVATGAYGGVLEVAGMNNSSPFVGVSLLTDNTATNHSLTFTTTTPNAIVIIGIRCSSNNDSVISSLSSGWSKGGLLRNGTGLLYNPDCGAPGSKTLTFTTSVNLGTTNYYVAEYKSAINDPTVTTVTGSTVTEGTANRYTVSLSAATNRTTTYPVSFGGTAVAGTDYDSNLANATFSTGASWVGGQLQLLTGYSSATIDVPTVNNALNQPTRTLILTVGGVASTGGNILDNDPLPAWTLSNARENGNVVNFDLSIPAPSGRNITFVMSTADIAGSMITAGIDYTARTSITVVIPAGQVKTTVTVNRLP